ncbi:MAG: hypothetical protein ACTSQI_12515 [Candidatus Helarchaeota archaeon]
MTLLKMTLQPDELVIAEFSKIKLHELEYRCVITNSRTILSSDKTAQKVEIEHKNIDHITFEKEWYIDLLYLIPISFCLAFISLFLGLFTYFPLSFTPANPALLRDFLYLGIVFTAIGIGAVYYYCTHVKFAVNIMLSKNQYDLESDYNSLFKFTRILKDIQSGKLSEGKSEPPLKFSNNQQLVSKIIILISTIFSVLIGWFWHYFQEFLYIPFLILCIGFIIGVLGYDEREVNPIMFKLGYLFLFMGITVIAYMFYIDFLPIPGLITLLLGSILVLYS